jgi:hypothetical protein
MKKFLLFITLSLVLHYAMAQQYVPSIHTVVSKPLGLTKTPTDARSYFYDAVHFVYRPYVSTTEVLSYLSSTNATLKAQYRSGQFTIIINTGGTLNSSNGVLTGGTNVEWWFKDGTDDASLVVKSAITSGSGPNDFRNNAQNALVYAPISSQLRADTAAEQLMDRFVPGSLSNQNGFLVGAGSTAVSKGAAGNLISADFNSGYVVAPRHVGKGHIRVLISGSNHKPMIGIGALGNFLGVWSGNGSTWEIGQVANGYQASSFAQIAVTEGAEEWVDINYNGQSAGSVMKVTLWPNDGTAMPSAPTLSYTFTGSELQITDDRLLLYTIGSTAVNYKSLSVSDLASQAKLQANYDGYWFPVTRNGVPYLCTINQGSEFNFDVQNASNVNLNIYADSRTSYPPQLTIVVDGVVRNIVTVSGNGAITLPIVSNLDPTKKHHIVVAVKGVMETDDVWNSQLGFLINGITTDGLLTKTADNRPIMWVFGDSITAGIVSLGYATTGPVSQPKVSDGYNAYGNILGRRLDYRTFIRGFGGSGITVGGNGNVPAAATSFYNFANGYPMYNIFPPAIILINEGTNDFGHGNAGNTPADSAVFQAAYITQVNTVKALYPTAQVGIIQQFNQHYVAAEQAVAQATNSLYLQTRFFADAITTTDGTHPDLNGHAVLADGLYHILSPQQLPNTEAVTLSPVRRGLYGDVKASQFVSVSSPTPIVGDFTQPTSSVAQYTHYGNTQGNNYVGVDESGNAVIQTTNTPIVFKAGGFAGASIDVLGNQSGNSYTSVGLGTSFPFSAVKSTALPVYFRAGNSLGTSFMGVDASGSGVIQTAGGDIKFLPDGVPGPVILRSTLGIVSPGAVTAPNLLNWRYDLTTAPTSTSTGTKGDVYFDGSYLYICYATNQWARVPYDTTF